MSYTSEVTKAWRKRTKERLVKILGGKCRVCGYKKCNAALHFHHVDPTKKEFSFGTSYSISWERLVEEFKKCVLVCGNCHSEIHAGITECPELIEYDFSYTKYEMNVVEREKRKCFFCSKKYEAKVNSLQKYCSGGCRARARTKVNWDLVDWSKNNNQIADEYEVSWAAVRKQRNKRTGSV